MDDERRGSGQGRLGSWLGDYEDLVKHEGGEGANGEPLRVRKLWNPVTYRCAYCGASFLSKAMIRHHLERHHQHDETDADEQVDLAA